MTILPDMLAFFAIVTWSIIGVFIFTAIIVTHDVKLPTRHFVIWAAVSGPMVWLLCGLTYLAFLMDRKRGKSYGRE